MSQNFSPDEVEVFRQVFRQFDEDGDETIDVAELGTALIQLGIETTPEEIEEMIRSVDTDGGGSIDFEEFLTLMANRRNAQGGGESEESDVESVQSDVSFSSTVAKESREALLQKLEVLRTVREDLMEVLDPTTPAAGAAAEGAEEDEAAAAAPTFRITTPVGDGDHPAAGDGNNAPQMPLNDVDTLARVTEQLVSEGCEDLVDETESDTVETAIVNLLKRVEGRLAAIEAHINPTIDFVEVGLEDYYATVHDTARFNDVDPSQLEQDLGELENFAFEKVQGPETKFGADAFRHKAKDFPFFMFPIETICEQLDAIDEGYKRLNALLGGKEFLLKPRCPEGVKCKMKEFPEHKVQFTHPCYSTETPCPHAHRVMHMKCYTHGSEESMQNEKAHIEKLSQSLGVVNVNGLGIADSGSACLSFVLTRDASLSKESRKYREIIASNNHISPTGALPLLDACTELTSVDLSCNNLGYRGALLMGGSVGPAIQKLLLRSDTITSLNLSRNRLSDTDAKYIAEGVKNNSVLRHLDLRKNELGPNFGVEMAAALSDNRSLRELLIGWNMLESSGTRALLNELQSCGTLEIIDMSWTGINEEGAKHIAEMVSKDPLLKTLNVSHNSIGAQGCALLSKALLANKNLSYMDISHNPLGEVAASDLVRELKDNSTLEHLDIRNCKTSDVTLREINTTLAAREPKIGGKQIILCSS